LIKKVECEGRCGGIFLEKFKINIDYQYFKWLVFRYALFGDITYCGDGKLNFSFIKLT
jgi:hypothetical protein